MTKPSVFTKIIKGEIPAYKVYEDDKTIVILPLHPTALAHLLVIPKKQVDQFFELEPEDYSAVMATVKKMAIHLDKVLKPARIGLKVVGNDVPHVHVHVIAFDTSEQYDEQENFSEPVDHEKLEKMLKQIAF